MRTRSKLRSAVLLLGALALPLVAVAEEFRQSVRVAPGGRLEVDLDSGSVEVETDDEPVVSVQAFAEGWGADSKEFELESDGTNARLRGHGRSWLSPRVRVRITVPERYDVEIQTQGGSIEIDELGGSVQAATSGGSIEVDGAQGSVELETSGGEIQADEVRGDVRAQTSGGSIEISEVTGSVDARTQGGSIQAHDVGGRVDAHTSGGSISVRFTGVVEGEIETAGGSIEVELPEGAAFDLDATTHGGRVELEPEIQLTGRIQPGRVKGQVGGGGPELRLATSGGNVRVESH